mmetsp:Transcript_62966/g.150145  ORF Transcript_62966/g.150145 Transcript_62966/m.150145 type:complete len:277 (-) Transcript_62966:429-1259(-)
MAVRTAPLLSLAPVSSCPRISSRFGTSLGLKSSTCWGSSGTQIRCVFGCTQKGDLSKWFIDLDTAISRRGYVSLKTMNRIFSSADISPLFALFAIFLYTSFWRSSHLSATARSRLFFLLHSLRSFSLISSLSRRSRVLAHCEGAPSVVCSMSNQPCSSAHFSNSGRRVSSYARLREGCRCFMPGRFVFSFSPPLMAERYSATAERVELFMCRARSSHTQQWIPRRPEKTQRRCLNPKSSRSALSSTLHAIAMKRQLLVNWGSEGSMQLVTIVPSSW